MHNKYDNKYNKKYNNKYEKDQNFNDFLIKIGWKMGKINFYVLLLFNMDYFHKTTSCYRTP